MKLKKLSALQGYWLLGLTLILFLQCSREEAQFTELLPEETGLNFSNDIVETQYNNILTYEYAYNGAGIACGDLNGDELPDLYFSGNTVPNKLYLNKGNWRFEDVTSASGTEGRKDWKTGVTMADVNGDGWLDIYVCYSGNAPGEGYNLPVVRDYRKRANELFINNGCKPGGVPVFTESAKEYGLDALGTFSTQAYFFDYDRDGDLDMFLLNHANMFYAAFFNTKRLRNLRHPYFGNKLYRNDTPSTPGENKPGVFTEVSSEAGIHGSGLNFGLSAAISDLDLDGWPDIYVTNDYEEQDFCYINNRNGTFTEASHTMFAHLSKFGMGSDIADVNNDGLQDILVLDMLPEDNYRQKLLKGPDEYDRYMLAVDSGYHHQYMRNTLQLNRGFGSDSLPRFSEVGQMFGISNTDWSWTPYFADFDNDGLKDIFISNGYPRDFTNMDFMKYTSEAYQQAKSSNQKADYLKIIQKLPQTRISNYMFKNEDGLNFTNVTESWGLSKPSVSNGAVYADLDNDGDHDIITNELNDRVTVWRNNNNEIQKNNYLKIRLKGKAPNTYGIGAKITVTTDSMEIFQEAFFTRGYASSLEPVLTIGIGKSTSVKSIKVYWPDGLQSSMVDVNLNQTLTIDHRSASNQDKRVPANKPNETVLTEVNKLSGVSFKHEENKFVDFKTQRLLHYQLSRLGGKLAIADVNGDGNDDVFFGGAAGQSGELFFGRDNGTFSIPEKKSWAADAAHEDMESLFFDADNDNDVDLYVVSGGSEFPSGASRYQDRIYVNDGVGNFTRHDEALPAETTSGSCVTAADFDKDGDQDIFVGGRHSPGSYGLVPRSFLLRNKLNEKLFQFEDATAEISPALSNVGMVTDAIWTDFNNDTWPDLIVVGEWMPVRVFENQKGKLIEKTDIPSIEKSNGWWCSIYAADIGNDGDMDYFLGNAGKNMQFRASPDKPVELFAGDFNNDNVIDPIVTYYIQNKSYPLASRDELLDQIASLRKKFVKYEDYARANIDIITDDEALAKSYKFKAHVLESCWLENMQGKFELHKLPLIAQLSSINGFLSEDFNNDGSPELLFAGNFFPYKAQLGRNDASVGGVLKLEKNVLKSVSGIRTNVWLSGDIRDMGIMRFKSGEKRLIVSRNNDYASVYSFN